jgi:uncharacterized protein YbjT (DUF2867 family)
MFGKLAQEEAVRGSSLPYTILRATQFFEFIGRIADSSMSGDAIHLPPVLVQPEAADDVAATLAETAVATPVNGIVEMAGPEQFRFDELIRRYFDATNDSRLVETDAHARYFGAELENDSLVPLGDAHIAPTRLEDWLSQPVSM